MLKSINKCSIALMGALAAVIVILVMLSPVFSLKTISVTGLNKLSEQEILSAAGLDGKANYFLARSGKAEKILSKNPYIASVNIEKIFPNTLTIDINERKVYGYVKDMENYVYIDNEGRVLDVRNDIADKLPVIVGLKYVSYSKGEILEVDKPQAFNTVVLLANLFSAYELEHDIIKADIKNEDDIRLYIYEIEVMMGDVAEIKDKIRYLKEILPLIPFDIKTVKGTLDLNSGFRGEAARFRRLA